ncbi:hypothetical protein CCAX7_004540 [Capsulimonas corticalis]|uniref:Uncharacterized protein n=1 Tax=Capsulimonas corticalis TaxID=2219043 RepID=A0A402D2S8_9BACT|nr:response regulator [Capsulimonas corticalis]BDI28403.1 hypothetical protein CCAX7_004540 [Capsulimonas corticalis]
MSKGTILIVDDTTDSLRLLAEILLAEGYTVRPADSGELALASAATNPPELILLDIRMPKIDGFEVCRRLKTRVETRDIPVIFISAMNAIDERVEGLKLGAVDFISKPYQRAELLARVHNHLTQSRMRLDLEKLVMERTAELRISKGVLDQAVKSAMEQHDWGLAVRLMEANAFPIIAQSEEIRQWLLGLPATALEAQPKLAYWRAFVLLGTGKLSAAEDALRIAERGCAREGDLLGQISVRAMMASVAASRGEGARSVLLSKEALGLIPADSYLSRALAHHWLGCAYCVSGLPILAEEEFLEANALSERLEGAQRWLIPISFAWYGRALFLQGRCNTALAVCRQASSLDRQYGGVLYSPNILFECDIHIERNLMDAASQLLGKSLDLSGPVDQWNAEPSAWVSAAQVRYAEGDSEAGDYIVENLCAWAKRNGGVHFQNLAEAVRAQYWLKDGQLERAAMWAAERELGVDDEIEYSRERLYLAVAQLRLERDRRAKDPASVGHAIRLLGRLRSAAERDCRMGDALQCLVLEALAFDQVGDLDASYKALEKALSLIISESSFRVLLDQGAPMQRLLQAVSRRGLLPETTSSLSAMFDPAPSGVSSQSEAASSMATHEPLSGILTERELDLLKLIHAGYSNAEISDSLFISHNTVKTHIKNLYLKLNARNRTQALARARDFGIIA